MPEEKIYSFYAMPQENYKISAVEKVEENIDPVCGRYHDSKFWYFIVELHASSTHWPILKTNHAVGCSLDFVGEPFISKATNISSIGCAARSWGCAYRDSPLRPTQGQLIATVGNFILLTNIDLHQLILVDGTRSSSYSASDQEATSGFSNIT